MHLSLIRMSDTTFISTKMSDGRGNETRTKLSIDPEYKKWEEENGNFEATSMHEENVHVSSNTFGPIENYFLFWNEHSGT